MSDFHELTIAGECPIGVRDFGGEGPHVLLLPGAGRTLEDWTRFADGLLPDHRVVAMDLRNHGRSGRGTWTGEEALDDIGRVIAATDLAEPVLIGHSLGGMLSAQYAVERGGVSGVINMDGYGHGRPAQYVGVAPEDVVAYHRAMREGAAQTDDAGGPATADRVLALLTAQLTQSETAGLPLAGEVAGLARSLRTGPEGETLMQPTGQDVLDLLDALESVDWMTDVFGKIPVPFLLYSCEALSGAEGETLRLMSAYAQGLRRDLEELSARATNVQVRFLDGHHGFILTMPRELAEEARAFIEALPLSSRASVV